MFKKLDVEFSAIDGTILRAWLFKPTDSSKRYPAITMAHGFSATRWHGLEKLAVAFAAAGFVVLFHDHRNFGGSDGTPRQDIDPWRQIEDWRQAITYLEALDYVDPTRIGIWGTSFSGGHAIVLGATDRRLRAVVAQVPTIDGFVSGQRRVPAGSIAVLEALFDEDLRSQLRGETPHTIRIADADPSVPAQYHTKDTVDFLLQPVPEGMWKNELTLQSNRRSRMYEPGRWIDRISPTPLLMIATTNDTTAPSDLTLAAYERALQPKSLILIKGGHYTPYLEGFEESSKAAIDWFLRKL